MLLLDLSYNNLTTIALRRSPCVLKNLIKLDLSHNVLPYLAHMVFQCFVALRELHISWNPLLSSIESRAFWRLAELQVLSLDHTSLGGISMNVFNHFTHLSVLNISNSRLRKVLLFSCELQLHIEVIDLSSNSLEIIEREAVHCFREVRRIVGDQEGLCCLKGIAAICQWKHSTGLCERLLILDGLHQILIVMGSIILIGNGFVLLYTFCDAFQNESVFLWNLAASNLLSIEPLALAVFWDQAYGTELSFYQKTIARSPQCTITYFVTMLSMQISNTMLASLAISKYIGINRSYVKKNYSSRNVIKVVGAAWVTWSLLVLYDVTTSTRAYIGYCFAGHTQNSWHANMNIVCILFNTISFITIVVLYGKMVFHVGTRMDVNRTRVYSAVIRRLALTIATTVLCLLPSILNSVLLAFGDRGDLRYSAAFVDRKSVV
jgi:hypothetical protein